MSSTTTIPTTTTTTSSPWIVTDVVKSDALANKNESKINSIISKVVGFFKDQKPHGSNVDTTKTNVTKQTTSPMGLSTTPTPKAAITRLTTSIANAPIVEVLDETEASDLLPTIDLAPFAKSSAPFDKDVKVTSVPARVTPPKSLTTESTLSDKATTLKPHQTSITPSNGITDSTTRTNSSTITSVPLSKIVNASNDTQSKSFFQKADDFFERNILNLRKLLQ